MPDLVRVRELVSEPHTLSSAAEVMTEAGVADVPDRLFGWSLPPEAEQLGVREPMHLCAIGSRRADAARVKLLESGPALQAQLLDAAASEASLS